MTKFAASTALALVMSVPAFAQTTEMQTQDQAAAEDTGMQQAGGFYQATGQELYASELIGQDVYAPQTGEAQAADPAATDTAAPDAGDPAATATDPVADTGGEMAGGTVTADQLDQMENIGQVSELLMDEQGEVVAVVVGVGGFLGLGEHEVALGLDQLDFVRDADDPDQFYVVTQVAADQLENAPEFERQDEQDGMQAQQQDPAAGEGDMVPGTQAGQDWRGGRDAMGAPAMEREGYAQAEAQEITADNLVGANVYDVNDDNIGNVDDVVLGQDGSAEYAVVDVGGFLGIGAHTVAIGFDEMTVLHDDGWSDLRVYVDVTQEQLEAMPEYTEGAAAD